MPDSLGIFCQKHYVYLFYHLDSDDQDFFRINFGSEGFHFETVAEAAYPALALVYGAAGMFIISTLASLWPSIAAARKTVSDILRYQ